MRVRKGCRCPKHLHVPVAGATSREWNWEVATYKGGYPLGSGGEWVRLPTSVVYCHKCRQQWRTRAKFVDRIWQRDAVRRREQAAATRHMRGLEFGGRRAA